MEKKVQKESDEETYMSRVQAIMKNSIELSLLSNQSVFLYVHDKEKNRVIHYASDPSQSLLDVFN